MAFVRPAVKRAMSRIMPASPAPSLKGLGQTIVQRSKNCNDPEGVSTTAVTLRWCCEGFGDSRTKEDRPSSS